MKILNLIDVWEKLKSDIELEKISNICAFLEKIKNNSNWKIYYCGKDLHPTVYKILLECNNAEHTHDSLTVFNNTQQHLDYYFAGFHTNLCLFNSEIGIDKLLEIAVPKKYSFCILADLTCGLKFDNNLTIPEQADNLPFYRYSDPALTSMEQIESRIQNTRNVLINKILKNSSEIQID